MKIPNTIKESSRFFTRLPEKLLRSSFFFVFAAIFTIGYIFALSYPSVLPPEISASTGNYAAALNRMLLSGDFNVPGANARVKDTFKLGWVSGYQKKISVACTGINVIKSFKSDGTVSCGAVTKITMCTSIPSNAIWNSVSSIMQTRAGGVWTPTSVSSIYSTSASTTNCIYTCGSGFHTENAGASCVSNTKSCTIANGAGNQTWNGSSWNVCSVSSCNAGYTVSGNSCMQSCLLPWGGSIIHGASTTAYATSSVAYPSSCNSQTRTCSNGTMNGSYGYTSCNSGCPAWYTPNATYFACTKTTAIPLNCVDAGIAASWYKWKGRCGEQGGINFWNDSIITIWYVQSNNSFNLSYAGTVSSYGYGTNVTAFHNGFLCGGATYITNTTLCRY